jgi:hypothetical protein
MRNLVNSHRIGRRSWVLAASLSLGVLAANNLAPTVASAQSYPRTVNSGDSVEIDYGPGPQGNVVGGGALVTRGAGESFAITYLDDANAQQPPAGMVPMSVTDGETHTVWVPAGTDRVALALR